MGTAPFRTQSCAMIRRSVSPPPSATKPTVTLAEPAPGAAPSRLASLQQWLGRLAVGQWAGAATILFLLVALLPAFFEGDGSEGSASADEVRTSEPSTSSTSTTTVVPPAEVQRLQAVVDEVAAFLADVHDLGLDGFTVPVEIGQPGPDPSDALVGRVAGSELAAVLGLVDARIPWAESAGIATYDPEGDRLRISRSAESVGVEERLAVLRALVHALHHRRYDVGSVPGPDGALAHLALLEGDAARMVDAYVADLPFEERQAARGQEDDEESRGIGTVLMLAVERGRDFTDRVDLAEALDEPPTTTEQISHPDRYRFGELGLDVSPPRGEGTVVDGGTAGEVLLAGTLMQAIADRDAAEAADGWGGDAFAVRRVDGDVRLAWRFIMDSAADRTELLSALGGWSQWHGSVRVSEEGRRIVVLLEGTPERRVPTTTTR